MKTTSEAARLGLADIAAMLWTDRALVIGVGGAICVLGLIAALGSLLYLPIMIVTLLTALVVSLAAGLSRVLMRADAQPPPAGRPMLTLIQGGA